MVVGPGVVMGGTVAMDDHTEGTLPWSEVWPPFGGAMGGGPAVAAGVAARGAAEGMPPPSHGVIEPAITHGRGAKVVVRAHGIAVVVVVVTVVHGRAVVVVVVVHGSGVLGRGVFHGSVVMVVTNQ